GRRYRTGLLLAGPWGPTAEIAGQTCRIGSRTRHGCAHPSPDTRAPGPCATAPENGKAAPWVAVPLARRGMSRPAAAAPLPRPWRRGVEGLDPRHGFGKDRPAPLAGR